MPPQTFPPRLLLVDDEALIRRSLCRLIKRYRPDWTVVAVESGARALERLDTEPFDLCLSDMTMHGMDGVQLLGEIKQRYPEMVRFLFSGYSDLKQSQEAVAVAHQFLAKTIPPMELIRVVERAILEQRRLPAAAMRALIGGSNELPAAPSTWAALEATLKDPSTSLPDLALVVQQDVAVTARVMQLASSAFFGLPHHVDTIEGAVSFLGISTLRALVLTAEMVPKFTVGSVPGFSIEGFQRHGLATGRLAQLMLRGNRALADQALLAGILHDVGKLVLAARAPERLAANLADSDLSELPLHVIESREGGITHAEVGAYLLSLWGLPRLVVDAVRRHHHPPSQSHVFTVEAAVHLADLIAHEIEGDRPHDDPSLYASDIGVGHKLEPWRQRALRMSAS